MGALHEVKVVRTRQHTSAGFTLVELIVVILLIAVLGVTVLPKLQGTSDYQLLSQRDQLVSLLRTVQSRAMQNTQQNAAKCHRILFNPSSIGLAAQVTTGSNAGACTTNIVDVSATTISDYLSLTELDSYQAINYQNGSITSIDFDSWGRPTPNAGSCIRNGCKISFSAEYAACINNEGYIHACQ